MKAHSKDHPKRHHHRKGASKAQRERAEHAREEAARIAAQERLALLEFRRARDASINTLLSELVDATQQQDTDEMPPQEMINPLGQAAIVQSPIDPHRIHPVYRSARPHNGTDTVPANGSSESRVLAAADGFILYKGAFSKDAGQTVLIYHPHGPDGPYITGYMHLKEGSLTSLAPGSPVAQGDMIGRMGATGVGTGPHLHFVVRKLNPRPEDMPIRQEKATKSLDDDDGSLPMEEPVDPSRSYLSYTVIRPTINGVLYTTANQVMGWVKPAPVAAKEGRAPITLPPVVTGGEDCEEPFARCLPCVPALGRLLPPF